MLATAKNSHDAGDPPSLEREDGLTATNHYDTVSRRSVERHYRPRDSQHLRHFVKKPQRRSPLLNRLFWLRTKAIDHIVQVFLKNSGSDRHKVVINLGCGSDVLPWRLQDRYGDACESTLFIDVDFPSLMRMKRATVLTTPTLAHLIGQEYHVAEDGSNPLYLHSKNYCQIGCDFTDQETLQDAILPLIVPGSKVMVVAEMSLMYNDVASTDKLLGWIKGNLQAQVCMLEHCLPAGPDHPFAKKLLQDYEKSNAPLKSLRTYSSTRDQYERFRHLGWNSPRLWNLWQAWTEDEFIDAAERRVIDQMEPFDDWEDFILFARHFFVLHTSDEEQANAAESAISPRSYLVKEAKLTHHQLPKELKRKGGGAIRATTMEGRELLINALGAGNNGLSETYDVFSLEAGKSTIKIPTSGPSPRSGFTLIDLGGLGVLLAGGKSSALEQPLADCWLLSLGPRPRWTKTWDLPQGIYRHSAIRLGNSCMVLVLGGRTAQGVSADSFVFHPEKGWQICAVRTPMHMPLFGAAAWSVPDANGLTSSGDAFHGLICGGMGLSGIINAEVYRWDLDLADSQPSIGFEKFRSDNAPCPRLAVFGASVTTTNAHVHLCGGIGTDPRSDTLGQSIVQWDLATRNDLTQTLLLPLPSTNEDWPMLLGTSVSTYRNHLVLSGGGATTYPAGNLWAKGLHTIDLSSVSEYPVSRLPHIDLLGSPRITLVSASQTRDPSGDSAPVSLTAIPRIRLETAEDFRAILRERKPVIIEGLDFGPCLTKWTPAYLTDRVGLETEVIVHESAADNPRLDFNAKNFKYVTQAFGKVIEKIVGGGRLYLRSLSRSKPSDVPANLEDDFPSLAPDFKLPKELDFAKHSLFSSILRLSGRANMWLHYDVMANIYTQIRGTKQMILFPPRDATKLAFAPGASSSSFDVFSALRTEGLGGTQPHEATLGEGDALFLPAAWLHTATPLTDMSVAVNVFFRDLDSGYAEGRDVYGNRDLAAYEKGRQDVAKISRTFRNMPQDLRQFYLSRIADELLQLAENPQ